jgi:hypothetical protein
MRALIRRGEAALILPFRGGGPPKVVEGRVRLIRAWPYLMAMRPARSMRRMTTPHPDKTREPDAAAWLAENREAISSANAWVEAHGLPLRDFRLF